MMIYRPKNFFELEKIVNDKMRALYFSSQTSTVIPYAFIDKYCLEYKASLVDLSLLPQKITLQDDGVSVKVQGPVSWLTLKNFLQEYDKEVMASPTEELACVLSGIATSATGERSFCYGPIRKHLVWAKFLDGNGCWREVRSQKLLKESSLLEVDHTLLCAYQEMSKAYQNFKNPPFPHFETEVDLLVGTEGQLGIITEAILKVMKRVKTCVLFISLPKWEENFSQHYLIFLFASKNRGIIHSCEFLDSNSLQTVRENFSLKEKRDYLFLEINDDDNYFVKVIDGLLSSCTFLCQNDLLVMPLSKFHELRMDIPRKTSEKISRLGVTKKGTDVQVSDGCFENLIEIYRSFSKEGINYNLFGHFGDAHLHFNFFPNKNQLPHCEKLLENLYKQTKILQGSPFTEHGIGLLKQKFIHLFYDDNIQVPMFRYLKKQFDPYGVFFPGGLMSLKNY